jgi:hypothetical protein
MISKVILKCEREIIKNKNDRNIISDILKKIAKLPKLFNREKYSEQIVYLSDLIKTNDTFYNNFIESIEKIGLYIKIPNFSNCSLSNLQKTIKDTFNVDPVEKIVIPKKTIDWITSKFNIKDTVPVPDTDVIIDNVYVAPMYWLKLKQEAKLRITSRDFGSYNSSSKQPLQGKKKFDSNIIGQASRIGSMEIDSLIGSGCLRTLTEMFTVKSDHHSLKKDLITNYILNGEYNLPDDIPKDGFSKSITTSYIDFLTN